MKLDTFNKAEKIVEEIRAVDDHIYRLEKAEMSGGWLTYPTSGMYIKPKLRERLLTTLREYRHYLECQLLDINDEKDTEQPAQ